MLKTRHAKMTNCKGYYPMSLSPPVVRRLLNACIAILLVTLPYSGRAQVTTIQKRSDLKVSSRLLSEVQRLSRASRSSKMTEKDDRRIRTDGEGRIHAYIYLEEASESELQQLRALGIKIEITQQPLHVVQAWVPYSRLSALAALGFVKHVRQPDYPIVLTGSVNSEGDALLRANEIRIANGVDGSGIRVGVISNGVTTRLSAQQSGDLPANIDIDPSLPGSGDEGTAMLEIVHDLAPAAQLAFSGPATSLEMLNAISYLANSAFGGLGCHVIVDDLGFLGEPVFQDGAIAQRVEQVVAQGVTYVTATGNEAQRHYEKNYIDATANIAGQNMNVHDFGSAAGGASDVGQAITVGANASLTIVLQWSDSYFNPTDDYDLFITNISRTQILASSEDPQNGGSNQFAIEVAVFENTDAGSVPVEIVIRRDGANFRRVEMFYIGDSFTINQFNVPEGSIIPGQQSTPGAISVGAISVLDPGFDTIESFSSIGPARIVSPLSQNRDKPDIVAADGVVITGAGGFGSPFGANTRFFGTSAAAPHVAAIAALLLSHNQNLSPAQVKDAIQDSAIDLGASGRDNTYGHGRIDAFRAFQRVVTSIAEPEGAIPSSFSLAQNHPNPFNPSTVIEYANRQGQSVRMKLEIFNMLGQRIRTLVDRLHGTGSFQAVWDGRNDNERDVTSGLYVYRLSTDGKTLSRRMLLLR